MAFIQLHIYSESLGMQTSVNVVIPQKSTMGEIGLNGSVKSEAYKSLYLLHGLSDDQSIWMRRTSIERYANEYGICVIMPFGGRSFYFDQQNGEKYYTYIAKELPRIISEFLNVSDRREDRFIAGLSMGGYGALKIALKENDTFYAAAGLSSVADIHTEMFKTHLIGIAGEEEYLSKDEDLFALIEQKDGAKNKPKLYMWCGTEDFLYADNVKLKEYMKNFHYDYTYEESEGAHMWECWDKQIQRVLEWMFKEV